MRLWLGDARGAQDNLRDALDLDPDTRWAFNGLAMAACMLGRPEQARQAFARSRARLSPLSASLVYEAILHRASADSAAERTALEQAVAARPSRISAWILLADRHVRDGRPDRARHAWSMARGCSERLSPMLVLDDPQGLTDLPARAAQALLAMRGNRSSTVVTWCDADGLWRFDRLREPTR